MLILICNTFKIFVIIGNTRMVNTVMIQILFAAIRTKIFLYVVPIVECVILLITVISCYFYFRSCHLSNRYKHCTCVVKNDGFIYECENLPFPYLSCDQSVVWIFGRNKTKLHFNCVSVFGPHLYEQSVTKYIIEIYPTVVEAGLFLGPGKGAHDRAPHIKLNFCHILSAWGGK